MKVWVTEMRGVCIMKQAYDLHTVECVWNVMAHAQKPDFVLRRNGRVHLNRRGRQFSRLLAAEVCASAVVMMGTPCSEVVWSGVEGTGYPLNSLVSPFTFSPVRHRVPSRFNWTLHNTISQKKQQCIPTTQQQYLSTIQHNNKNNISKQSVHEPPFKIRTAMSYRGPCYRSIDRQSQEKKGEQN